MKMQLAFQGGGARFVAMLPLAHAFADARRRNDIEITRAAGSSAGAICAALIAYDADFTAVRRHILDNGAACLSTLIPRYLAGPGRPGLVACVRLLLAASSGKPVLRPTSLRKFLDGLFAASVARDPKAEPIEAVHERTGTELLLYTSDMHMARGREITHGNVTYELLSSCAIPIALRSFGDLPQTPYVDGGLCENLPVERLIRDEVEYGRAFAITYEEAEAAGSATGAGETAAGLASYMLALISASISHNVERSKAAIGKSNVVSVPTSLGTFAFREALTELADDDLYARRKKVADDMIALVLAQERGAPRGARAMSGRITAPRLMRSLYSILRPQEASSWWRYDEAALFVRTRSVRDSGIDRIARIAEIEVSDPRFFCFTSAARLDGPDALLATSWSCENLTTGKAVPFQVVPADDDARQSSAFVKVLVLFEDVQEHIEVGHRLRIRTEFQVWNAMRPLGERGQDKIVASNQSIRSIGRARAILAYPRDVGIVGALPADDQSVLQHADLAPIYGGFVEGDDMIGLEVKQVAPGQTFEGVFVLQRGSGSR